MPLRMIVQALMQSEIILTGIKDLLKCLDFERDTDLPAHNVSVLMKLDWTLTLASQDRAVAFMQSRQLQKWMTGACSSALHVNGYMFLNSGNGEERRSPLSFACAKLSDALLGQAEAEQKKAK